MVQTLHSVSSSLTAEAHLKYFPMVALSQGIDEKGTRVKGTPCVQQSDSVTGDQRSPEELTLE